MDSITLLSAEKDCWLGHRFAAAKLMMARDPRPVGLVQGVAALGLAGQRVVRQGSPAACVFFAENVSCRCGDCGALLMECGRGTPAGAELLAIFSSTAWDISPAKGRSSRRFSQAFRNARPCRVSCLLPKDFACAIRGLSPALILHVGVQRHGRILVHSLRMRVRRDVRLILASSLRFERFGASALDVSLQALVCRPSRGWRVLLPSTLSGEHQRERGGDSDPRDAHEKGPQRSITSYRSQSLGGACAWVPGPILSIT